MTVATSLYVNIRFREQNAKIRTALFKIGDYCRCIELKHDKIKYQACVKGQKLTKCKERHKKDTILDVLRKMGAGVMRITGSP
jgi:hypothetical protein